MYKSLLSYYILTIDFLGHSLVFFAWGFSSFRETTRETIDSVVTCSCYLPTGERKRKSRGVVISKISQRLASVPRLFIVIYFEAILHSNSEFFFFAILSGYLFDLNFPLTNRLCISTFRHLNRCIFFKTEIT